MACPAGLSGDTIRFELADEYIQICEVQIIGTLGKNIGPYYLRRRRLRRRLYARRTFFFFRLAHFEKLGRNKTMQGAAKRRPALLYYY